VNGLPAGIPARGHVPALDGLRGIAILLVMFHHCTVLSSQTQAATTLLNLAGIGAHGVDLFFVLSGYLITGILLDTREQARYFQNFYLRRALRIFPLYYLVVAGCILLLPAIAAHIPAASAKVGRFITAPGDWPWYVSYTSNFLIASTRSWRHPVLGVTWSLAIEEQFYLVWAVIVFLISPVRLRTTALWLAGLSLIFRAGMLLAGYDWIQVYVLTWCRMDGLALGAWVAAAVRGRTTQRLSSLPRLAAFTLTPLLVVLYGGGWLHYDMPAAMTIGYSAVALACAAWLYLALFAGTNSVLNRFLSGGILRFFGKYSYAIYLFHLPVRAAVRDTVFASPRLTALTGTGILWQLAFYAATLLVVIPCVLLSWNLLERPILKLKDRVAGYQAVAGSDRRALVGAA
jgi:peptidoglycan/LPS O-acetylase OafA/YrhL